MNSSSASAKSDQVDRQTDVKTSPDLPAPVQRYFETLNRGAFEQTAALFAENGRMVPPFEQPIQGRGAIAHYLGTEAHDMSLTPLECEPVAPAADQAEEAADANSLQRFLVRGKVKTHLLGVNVAWQFDLNAVDEITKVRIKLLASLQELIKFNR
ncbi:MAG: nuclear transport factor 2 family protein [Phormidesmis sp.]